MTVFFPTQKEKSLFYFDQVCFQETIFSSSLAQIDKQIDICPITISLNFHTNKKVSLYCPVFWTYTMVKHSILSINLEYRGNVQYVGIITVLIFLGQLDQYNYIIEVFPPNVFACSSCDFLALNCHCEQQIEILSFYQLIIILSHIT